MVIGRSCAACRISWILISSVPQSIEYIRPVGLKQQYFVKLDGSVPGVFGNSTEGFCWNQIRCTTTIVPNCNRTTSKTYAQTAWFTGHRIVNGRRICDILWCYYRNSQYPTVSMEVMVWTNFGGWSQDWGFSDEV